MLVDTYFEKARVALAEKKYEDALNHLDRLMINIRRETYKTSSNDPKVKILMIDAKFLETDIYMEQGQTDKSKETMEQIGTMLVGSDSSIIHQRGKLSYYKNKIAIIEEDEALAISSLEDSIKHFLQANSPPAAIDMSFRLLNQQKIRYDRLRSLELVDSILNSAKKISDKSKRQEYEGRGLLKRGQILDKIDTKEAIKSVEKALKDFQKLNKPIYEINCLLTLANYKLINNPKKAELLLLDAKSKSENVDAKLSLAMTLSKLMLLDLVDGQVQQADVRIKLAKGYLKEGPDNTALAVDCLSIAIKGLFMSSDDGFITQLRFYIDFAKQIFENTDNREGKTISKLIEIAYDFSLGKINDAESQLKMAQMLVKRYQQKDELFIDERLYPYLYIIHNLNGSQTDLFSGIKDNSKDFSSELIAEYLFYTGVYKMHSNVVEAKFFFKEGQDLFRKVNSKTPIIHIIQTRIDKLKA